MSPITLGSATLVDWSLVFTVFGMDDRHSQILLHYGVIFPPTNSIVLQMKFSYFRIIQKMMAVFLNCLYKNILVTEI